MTSKTVEVYCGRFAPSPTGPLHFGSLVALMCSYLDARSVQGKWLVRMEDLDPPREIPGAADDILRTIETLGVEWDESVWFQSRRTPQYEEALQQLRDLDTIYDCTCSRREIAGTGMPGNEGPIYPGTCRNTAPGHREVRSQRVRTNNDAIQITDLVQPGFEQRLESEIGDFIVRRGNGLFAYQLAVVVDDAAQGINHVVRGCDILMSTPRQIYLQELLHLPTPRYLHLPVATHGDGSKLSKQTQATPLDCKNPLPQLMRSLVFLGQQPPKELATATLEDFWTWAIRHWNHRKIPAQRAIPAPQNH